MVEKSAVRLKSIFRSSPRIHAVESPDLEAQPEPKEKFGIVFWFIISISTLALGALGILATYKVSNRPINLWSDAKPADEQIESIRVEIQKVRDAIGEKRDIDVLYFKILNLRPGIDYVFAHRVAKIVYEEARSQKMDPDFILALIRTESNFNPLARSPTGALGLTQVMPMWKEALPIEGSMTDPEVSVRAGVKIFKMYEKMYNGKTFVALAAYNRGPWAVNNALKNGEDPSVNGYSTNVYKFMTKLKALDRGREGIAE